MPADRIDNLDQAGVADRVNALPEARAALDTRLRAELGRQLTLVILRASTPVVASNEAASEATGDVSARFQAEIAAYQEVRLLRTHITQTSAFTTTFTAMCAPLPTTTTQTLDAALDAAFRDALRVDADAILVWRDEPTEPAGAADGDDERAWLRVILAVAERLNVFEVATVALVGPTVTRAQARALGYEDGYGLTEPLGAAVHDALAQLTREALARAEYRHKGSSPPCYL